MLQMNGDASEQVDALRPGLLGRDRVSFAMRYCDRRLVPLRRGGETRAKYITNGLSHAGELHALLKQASILPPFSIIP